MSTEKEENKLDKLFKNRLEDAVNEAAFREADWDAMEQMLDQGRKRRFGMVYLLPIISGIAAMLLIFLGYFFFKSNETKPEKKNQVATIHPTKAEAIDKAKNNTGTNGEPTRQLADSGKQQTKSAEYAATGPAQTSRAESGKTFFPLSSGKGRRGTGTRSQNSHDKQQVLAGNAAKNAANDRTALSTADNKADQKVDVLAGNGKPLTRDDRTALGTSDNKTGLGAVRDKSDVLANNGNKTTNGNDRTVLGTADSKTQVGAADLKGGQKIIAANPTAKNSKSAIRQNPASRPIFALGVIASSDLNGVNSSFQQSKIGGNFGATFSATFKKWTISTGAQYDVKPYLTSFDNYHTSYQFPTNPSSVRADCRMLDIPLNVNYRVYRQRANSISIGTGLSSYFMLREDYQFNYDNGTASGYGGATATSPLHYTVVNRNHNILSVLNIDATYTHQISSKFGVTVQPYTKVPLSDVGASQVRLQSTGVAFGINWNINASSKPK